MPPVLVHVSFAACPPFPALLHEGRVLALARWADVLGPEGHSMAALQQGWPRLEAPLRRLCDEPATAQAIARDGVPIDPLQLHAPVAPRQVFCTIGNYRAQWLEAALDADDGPHGPGADARRTQALAAMAARRRDGTPYVCHKGNAGIAGPCDPLVLPPTLEQLDWEVELGVVIGRPAWQVAVPDALQHVAGYCIVNDLTRRDRIFRDDVKALGSDWLQSKAAPGWLPCGPWFVPAWQVDDPQRLRLRLQLNGETMQDGDTGDMLFGIAEQIAYLSRHTRLLPGDLVCTGSPAGFGSHHRRFLRAGDIVEATIDGLGRQRVHCVAA
jgi:2-keto-4-pentenoate hydratase/2-oxohepta-3-ene-1,7-dioic acid hydratase in catechol pathway